MIQTKLLKPGSILLLLSFLVSFGSSSIWAEDYQNQLNTIKEKQQVQEEKKEEAENRIKSFSESLKEIQDSLAKANAELQKIETRRNQVEQEIKVNEVALKEAQAKYDKRMLVLQKRVREIYENGQLSYLDVILGAKNFNDFANRVELFRRIIKSDITLIQTIMEERKVIMEKKKTLEDNRAEIIRLQKDSEAKRALIIKKQNEESALLKKAESDKATALEALEGLERASSAIQQKLQALEEARKARERQAAAAGQASSSNAVRGSGQFSWPVNGPITSPFGYRYHPIWHRYILHSGIDIGVPVGTPVQAADSGVVELAGWISGYGYTVIVDHGNGFATLYAHNSQIIVSVGQHVRKGQTICYSGMTGWATGPHLHFEVRASGVPKNPVEYL